MSVIYHVDQYNFLPGHVVQILLCPADKKIRFTAGQYLFLTSPTGRQMPYSIANAPNDLGVIELHIRQKNDDPGLSLLLEDIKSNRQASVTGVSGQFEYPSQSTDSLVLLAGGTGFAQMKAIIEKAILTEDSRNIRLFWANTRLDDFYLLHLLKDWQAALDNFEYTLVCTQKVQLHDASVDSGLIYDAVLTAKVDLSSAQVIAAGPFAMVKDCFNQLRPHGLGAKQFYSDIFSAEESA